jgi:hypothetical protein
MGMRKVVIMLSCFRFIAVPSVVITIIASIFLWQSGTALFLVYAFWLKVITTSLLLLFARFFLSSQFYFFNNLGYSNAAIYKNMITMDLLIAVTAFSIALLI